MAKCDAAHWSARKHWLQKQANVSYHLHSAPPLSWIVSSIWVLRYLLHGLCVSLSRQNNIITKYVDERSAKASLSCPNRIATYCVVPIDNAVNDGCPCMRTQNINDIVFTLCLHCVYIVFTFRFLFTWSFTLSFTTSLTLSLPFTFSFTLPFAFARLFTRSFTFSFTFTCSFRLKSRCRFCSRLRFHLWNHVRLRLLVRSRLRFRYVFVCVFVYMFVYVSVYGFVYVFIVVYVYVSVVFSFSFTL